MSNPTQPRVVPGIPTGGQWRAADHAEADASLFAPASPELTEEILAARQAELAAGGFTPALAVRAVDDPRNTALREEWWASHFVTAEYLGAEAKTGQYRQMPDDYTPGMTDGQALSGHRRTHRYAYKGAGVTIRMPSATAIRRYEKDTGETFDVPVSYQTDTGESHSGWVRMTRSGPNWAAEGLGFNKDASIEVSEAVSAIMEARRPRQALSQIGNLLEHRKDKIAATGVPMTTVKSSWIEGVSYDDMTGVMTMQTKAKGALYGYRTNADVFDAVATAERPGAVFNELVRSKTPRIDVERCGDCGRFFTADAPHECAAPAHLPRPVVTSGMNMAARAAASRPFGARLFGRREQPAPAAPVVTEPVRAPGSHLPVPSDSRKVDVKWTLRKRWERRPKVRKPLYGTRYGWTAADGVADQVAAHASSHYVPEAFPSGARSNGDGGVVSFSGAGRDFAQALWNNTPAEAVQDRHQGGPTLQHAMYSAYANPGTIEVGGYVVGPDRQDERVSISTVYLFDDTDATPAGAWQRMKDVYRIDQGPHDDAKGTRPSDVEQVEVPWRPGEKAWRFRW